MFFKNFGAGPKWLPCKIVDVTGPVSFCVFCWRTGEINNAIRTSYVLGSWMTTLLRCPRFQRMKVFQSQLLLLLRQQMRLCANCHHLCNLNQLLSPCHQTLTLPTRQSQLAQEFLPLGDNAACCQPCPEEHRGLNVQSGILEGHQDLRRAWP